MGSSSPHRPDLLPPATLTHAVVGAVSKGEEVLGIHNVLLALGAHAVGVKLGGLGEALEGAGRQEGQGGQRGCVPGGTTFAAPAGQGLAFAQHPASQRTCMLAALMDGKTRVPLGMAYSSLSG